MKASEVGKYFYIKYPGRSNRKGWLCEGGSWSGLLSAIALHGLCESCRSTTSHDPRPTHPSPRYSCIFDAIGSLTNKIGVLFASDHLVACSDHLR